MTDEILYSKTGGVTLIMRGNFDRMGVTLIGMDYGRLSCKKIFSNPETLFCCRQDRKDSFLVAYGFVYDRKLYL